MFIATPERDSHLLAGFFTLSAGSVSCSELPEALAKKLPRYPVPVALIGRLAVDTDFQGKGVGSIFSGGCLSEGDARQRPYSRLLELW